MKKRFLFDHVKAQQGTPAQAIPTTQAESDYATAFLKRKEIKERQSVYISKEIHTGVSRLVHVLALAGKEISVGGFIDNVLTEHMEVHKEDIAELYHKQLDKFL